MKRIIAYITLIIAFITLGVLGFLNRPQERPSSEILGVTYYRYNPNTNTYDEFMITNEEISYTGTDYNLDGCKNYTYSSKTNIIKLDCGKAFSIEGESKTGIKLKEGDTSKFFYSEKENSYSYEFQKYFKTTENMYKSSGENALRDKEIDIEKLESLIKSDDTSFIYIKSSNCLSSCTIFNHAYSNFSNNLDTYYLNLDELTQEDITALHETYNTFPQRLTELKKDYPQVLVIGSGELKDTIKIEINGFDTSKYDNYVEKYKGENNEDE